ncbi:hypothetical protein ACFYWY_16645 [Streptomyces sp. NPDC002870]|uniref:hypothetical protein n=1 Tax=Streptomyces sp. NPDC002870 TaxID=3364666 RepID=UPI00368BE958
MDHDEVLSLFDHQMRQGGEGAGEARDVVRQVGADGDWNGVGVRVGTEQKTGVAVKSFDDL